MYQVSFSGKIRFFVLPNRVEDKVSQPIHIYVYHCRFNSCHGKKLRRVSEWGISQHNPLAVNWVIGVIEIWLRYSDCHLARPSGGVVIESDATYKLTKEGKVKAHQNNRPFGNILTD